LPLVPDSVELAPKSVDEWLVHFAPGRRKQYERALALAAGDDPICDGCRFSRSVIVKRELLPGCVSLEALATSTPEACIEVDADPRAISDVSVHTQLKLGPWMSAASEYLAQYWNDSGNVCYASGMTGEQIGLWFERARASIVDCIAFEADFSRFDRSVSQDAILAERGLYQRLGIPEPQRDVLDAQWITRGLTKRGRHFYSVPGTRKSGDPNTSVGNSFLNGLFMAYAMVVAGVPASAWRAICLGDDSLIMISRLYVGTADTIVAIAESLGLKFSKFHVRHLLTDCEFCSKLFWPVEGGYVLGPKIGRSLSKMGWTLSNTKARLARLRGVVLGQWASWSFLPLLRQFGHRLLELSEGVEPIAHDNLYGLLCTEEHYPNAETAVMFWDRYGWSWDAATSWAEVAAQQVHTVPAVVLTPLAGYFGVDI
jgi:hypothetical protein